MNSQIGSLFVVALFALSTAANAQGAGGGGAVPTTGSNSATSALPRTTDIAGLPWQVRIVQDATLNSSKFRDRPTDTAPLLLALCTLGRPHLKHPNTAGLGSVLMEMNT